MADLEMLYVKNGEGNNPLYQIGTRNADGSYNIMYTDYLKEHQAVAFLEKLKSQEAPVKVVVTEETTVVPDYKDMSKKELEQVMREHDIELDRRKSKSALLQQVETFFSGGSTKE